MKTPKEAVVFLYRVSRGADRSIEGDRAAFHETCSRALGMVMKALEPPEEKEEEESQDVEQAEEVAVADEGPVCEAVEEEPKDAGEA